LSSTIVKVPQFRLMPLARFESFLEHRAAGRDAAFQQYHGSVRWLDRGRKARSSTSNIASSSGARATATCAAPASRTIAATALEKQHCGSASAEISTPAARAASRKARALRAE
jgi:hypothetical protein